MKKIENSRLNFQMNSENRFKLDILLRASNAHLPINEIPGLLKGVSAAPNNDGGNGSPNSWMTLIAENPSEELTDYLASMLKKNRPATDKQIEPIDCFARRISSLRNQMLNSQLDGFIVPLADEFQGEYVPKCAQRLAWISGFTGSAGTAIILKNKACIFVDGRYTLQANRQVDKDFFQISPTLELKVTDWLKSNTNSNQKIGYDPWLHTVEGSKKLRLALKQSDAKLIAVEQNLIDKIWIHQPVKPLSPVEIHDIMYTGESTESKKARIANGLSARGHDALVLTSPSSIAWLLNIRGGDVPYTPYTLAFGILHANSKVDLFIDLRKLKPSVTQILKKATRLHPIDKFTSFLNKSHVKSKTVQLDKNTTADAIGSLLTNAGAFISVCEDPCAIPKSCKNPTEIRGFRASHSRDGLALIRFLSWLQQEIPNGKVSEISAANKLETFRREQVLIRGLSFPTISSFGSNGAIIHYRATQKSNQKLKKGNLYLVDSGGQYLDGTTDVTRTISIGKPTKEMKDRFTRVLKGHIQLAMAEFPKGTTGSQLDILARSPLWEIGLDYEHGTGHGVGHYLGVHEGPQSISKSPNSVPLREGMILSNEPGYYKEGAFGIRIENLVAVKEIKRNKITILGFETLTLAPIDLTLVEKTLLSRKQIQWLNNYHSKVYKTHSHSLSSDEKIWLKNATSKL